MVHQVPPGSPGGSHEAFGDAEFFTDSFWRSGAAVSGIASIVGVSYVVAFLLALLPEFPISNLAKLLFQKQYQK